MKKPGAGSAGGVLRGMLLCGAASLLTLAVFEGALRLLDYPPGDFSPWVSSPETGFKFAGNLSRRMVAPEYDVLFETNTLGLRDDEIDPEKTGGILLLGDSFTCGQGVDREDLFADIVERGLNTRVINAGVSGFQIIHQYNYFRRTGWKFKPDLVVYALYLGNDLCRNDEWELDGEGNLAGKGIHWPVRAAQNFKIASTVKWLVYSKRATRVREEGGWRPPPDYLALCRRELDESAAADYRRSKELLAMLRDEVESAGAELFVLMFPYRTAVEDQAVLAAEALFGERLEMYDYDRPAREIGRFLDELGVENRCLNREMREYYQTASAPLYFFHDGHFTKEGHRFVAGALIPMLRKKQEVQL